MNHRNQWWWYAISGSDDLGWAALALIYAIDLDKPFRDTYMSYNGPYYEKGLKELMKKIDDVFRDENRHLFWGLSRDPYYASISITLTIILNQKLYMLTRDIRYLNQSLTDYKWLTDRPELFNDKGLLMDGKNADGSYFDRNTYSYNQGTIILVYGLYYQISKDEKYLRLGIRHAKNVIKYMSNEDQIIVEDIA